MTNRDLFCYWMLCFGSAARGQAHSRGLGTLVLVAKAFARLLCGGYIVRDT